MNRFVRFGISGFVFVIGVVVMFLVLTSATQAAYTTISVQSIAVDGLTPVYSNAVAGGCQFLNDGRVMIHLRNTNAAARYVTITTPYAEGGLALADVYLTVPGSTGNVFAGPFPTKLFNNSGGYVQIDFSAVDGLTIAALQLR